MIRGVNKSKIKVMSIFGTRPEAIKIAPLIKKLERSPFIEAITVVTAQHREMLDQVLSLFKIMPHYDLNVMKDGQTLTSITTEVLQGMSKIYQIEKPDIVLVHGDTTTTFSASLSAFYEKICIGHVEAGLRTNNKYSPYPEEINRKLTSCLADLHFCPTNQSKINLMNEGIPESKITVTGNTVIDALLSTIDENYIFCEKDLEKVDFSKKILLVTSHRRENLGAPMERIFDAIRKIVYENNDLEVIIPMHKNPKVREIINVHLFGNDRVHLIEPLEYKSFVNLINRSYLILTDSGGIQEEAPALGKPVLVLRDTTERPEAVEYGTVKLVGTDSETIIRETNLLLNNRSEYDKMANSENPYGDGKASDRIVDRILDFFLN